MTFAYVNNNIISIQLTWAYGIQLIHSLVVDIYAVTYPISSEQTFSEALSGQMKFLSPNFGAPGIEWFPFFVSGKKGDAH